MFAALIIVAALAQAAPPDTEPPPAPARPTADAGPTVAGKTTHVIWKRGADGTVVIEATSAGQRHQDAQRDLQKLADRLDALRTVERHVRWNRLEWHDDRILAFAVAEDAVWGSLAKAVVRDMLPGRSTAGSGVQQMRAANGRFEWRVKMVVGAPPASE